MIGLELQRALVAEAALAPSVHNVQPARWRFEGDEVLLVEDETRRLAIGDPEGRDAGVSLGAAAEGMRIALSRHGLAMREVAERRFGVEPGAEVDSLATFVERRQSYRGCFLKPREEDRAAARALGSDGVAVVSEAEEIGRIAKLVDEAGLAFFRDPAFRGELVSWMRLSRSHSGWSRDGLNAEAMAMSRVEAIGAKAVLGRAFGWLDRLGLGPALTGEAGKIATSAAVLIVHRPADESPFETGRFFYRLWLKVVEAGFQAAVMASLADHEAISARLAGELGVPEGRRIRTALRIGRVPEGAGYKRARLPVDELIL